MEKDDIRKRKEARRLTLPAANVTCVTWTRPSLWSQSALVSVVCIHLGRLSLAEKVLSLYSLWSVSLCGAPSCELCSYFVFRILPSVPLPFWWIRRVWRK